MNGIPEGTQSGAPVVPASTAEENQPGENKKRVVVDAGTPVGIAADKGTGKPGGKTLFDRSVSQTSVKSNDSGFSEGADEMEEPVTGFYEVLEESLMDEPELLDNLKIFEKVRDKQQAIVKYLQNPAYTKQEKQHYLAAETRLNSHMAREKDGTSPEAAEHAIESMLYMLSEVAKFEEPQRTEVAKKLLDADGPCFEAKCTNAQAVFAAATGIDGVENNNVLSLSDALDKTSNMNTIFLAFYHDYMAKNADELSEGLPTRAKFSAWLEQQDGVMGFKAFDGEMTTVKLGEFCDYMVKSYVMEEE